MKLNQSLCALAMLFIACSIVPSVSSQQIIPDGMTQTSITTTGTVTDIITNTIKNDSAFNSFSKFNVDEGSTANLVLPLGTEHLINIIKSESSQINGVLNALKDGTIGGHAYFVNPHGIIIGKTGTINTGSLTLVTPTQDYVDNFFDSPDNPNDMFLNDLLNGDVSINGNAVIEVNGVVNFKNNFQSASGQFTNNGTIQDEGIEPAIYFNDDNIPLYSQLFITSEGNINQNGKIAAFNSRLESKGDINLGGTISSTGKYGSIDLVSEGNIYNTSNIPDLIHVSSGHINLNAAQNVGTIDQPIHVSNTAGNAIYAASPNGNINLKTTYGGPIGPADDITQNISIVDARTSQGNVSIASTGNLRTSNMMGDNITLKANGNLVTSLYNIKNNFIAEGNGDMYIDYSQTIGNPVTSKIINTGDSTKGIILTSLNNDILIGEVIHKNNGPITIKTTDNSYFLGKGPTQILRSPDTVPINVSGGDIILRAITSVGTPENPIVVQSSTNNVRAEHVISIDLVKSTSSCQSSHCSLFDQRVTYGTNNVYVVDPNNNPIINSDNKEPSTVDRFPRNGFSVKSVAYNPEAYAQDEIIDLQKFDQDRAYQYKILGIVDVPVENPGDNITHISTVNDSRQVQGSDHLPGMVEEISRDVSSILSDSTTIFMPNYDPNGDLELYNINISSQDDVVQFDQEQN